MQQLLEIRQQSNRNWMKICSKYTNNKAVKKSSSSDCYLKLENNKNFEASY